MIIMIITQGNDTTLSLAYILFLSLTIQCGRNFRYGNILHFTDGSKAGSYGSKTPMIQIWKGGFEVLSAIDSSPGATFYINQQPPAPVREWTLIQVVQQKFSENYHLNISIGDTHSSTINQRAEEFSNVQVYASSPWFQSQPGQIRRLQIESELVEENLLPLALGLTSSTALVLLAIALLLFMMWRLNKFGGVRQNVMVREMISFLSSRLVKVICSFNTFFQVVENGAGVVNRSLSYGQDGKEWEGAQIKDNNPDYGNVW